MTQEDLEHKTLIFKGSSSENSKKEGRKESIYDGKTFLKKAVEDLAKKITTAILMGKRQGKQLNIKGTKFNVALHYQSSPGVYTKIDITFRYMTTRPDPKEPPEYRLLQSDPFYNNRELHTFATDLPINDPRRGSILVQIIDESDEEQTQKMPKLSPISEETKPEPEFIVEEEISGKELLKHPDNFEVPVQEEFKDLRESATDTAVLEGLGDKIRKDSERIKQKDTRRRLKKIDKNFTFEG